MNSRQILRKREKEEKKGKKMEGGRNHSWSVFSMVISLFFFFSLGVGVMQAMDYSNQSEKSVGSIYTLIPFG